jgi:hypothetical protein
MFFNAWNRATNWVDYTRSANPTWSHGATRAEKWVALGAEHVAAFRCRHGLHCRSIKAKCLLTGPITLFGIRDGRMVLVPAPVANGKEPFEEGGGAQAYVKASLVLEYNICLLSTSHHPVLGVPQGLRRTLLLVIWVPSSMEVGEYWDLPTIVLYLKRYRMRGHLTDVEAYSYLGYRPATDSVYHNEPYIARMHTLELLPVRPSKLFWPEPSNLRRLCSTQVATECGAYRASSKH